MLPLPRLLVCARTRGGERHRTVHESRRARQLTNSAIDAINWLHEGSSSEPHREPFSVAPDGLQREVQQFLGSQCRQHLEEFDVHASALRGDAALTALLKGRGLYEHGPASSLAAFSQARVSAPSTAAGVPALEVDGPEDVRRMLNEPGENMMSNSEVDGASEGLCYWDPVLDRHARKYRNLITFLNDRKLLNFILYPSETIGMCFVAKKDGVHIRMIVDARRANRHFKVPPHVALCTAEGITRIEMELSDHVDPWTPEGVKMLSEACSALGCWMSRTVFTAWLSLAGFPGTSDSGR